MTKTDQDPVPRRYGDSAADLETLRKLVEERCPMAMFAGHTQTGSELGEYRFLLSPLDGSWKGQSIYVRAPRTPAGHLRDRLGLWCFRRAPINNRTIEWRRATHVETVVDWICHEAKSAHTRRPRLAHTRKR